MFECILLNLSGQFNFIYHKTLSNLSSKYYVYKNIDKKKHLSLKNNVFITNTWSEWALYFQTYIIYFAYVLYMCIYKIILIKIKEVSEGFTN